MTWVIVIAAFIAGGITAIAVILFMVNKCKPRRPKKKPPGKGKRKVEFTKIVLSLVLLTYFIGVWIGVKIALIDFSQLGILLAFIGTPTAVAIGFYAWKARAENVIKIKKDNPEETEGIPIDLNNINV